MTDVIINDLPQLAIVNHEIMLLTQPAFDTPAIAVIEAGTRIAPYSYHNGFFEITYHQHIGFIPAAVCRVDIDKEIWNKSLITFVNSEAILARKLPSQDNDESRVAVNSNESLLVLGQDKKFLLVQREDGRIGYLPIIYCDKPIISKQGRDTNYQIVSSWIMSGFGWSIINYWGLTKITSQTDFFLFPSYLHWDVLVVFISIVAMWLGPRQYPERYFVFGPLLLFVIMSFSILNVLFG